MQASRKGKSKRTLSIHEKMMHKQNFSYSCLEEIDTFGKVTGILLRNQDGKAKCSSSK